VGNLRGCVQDGNHVYGQAGRHTMALGPEHLLAGLSIKDLYDLLENHIVEW
jgi:hypothetical protein